MFRTICDFGLTVELGCEVLKVQGGGIDIRSHRNHGTGGRVRPSEHDEVDHTMMTGERKESDGWLTFPFGEVGPSAFDFRSLLDSALSLFQPSFITRHLRLPLITAKTYSELHRYPRHGGCCHQPALPELTAHGWQSQLD